MHDDALHGAGLEQRKYGMLLLLLLACAAYLGCLLEGSGSNQNQMCFYAQTLLVGRHS